MAESYITPSNYGFEYLRWFMGAVKSDASQYQRNVFGGAVTVYNITITNDSDSTVYVKIYDARQEFLGGAGSPTPPVGVAYQIPLMIIPVSGSNMLNIPFPNGYSFSNGFTIRAVKGAADSSTADPSNGNVGALVVGKKNV